MELRCTLWRSHSRPSATVNTGGVGVGLGEVFADQEGGGLPAGHQHAELLHELLQLVVRVSVFLTGQHDRAERVDEHQARAPGRHFLDDAPERLVEVAGHRVFGQVDEAHALVDGFAVEEVELLLVAQHLQRRLAQHGEVERRPDSASPARKSGPGCP
jgi:hypothetical protein